MTDPASKAVREARERLTADAAQAGDGYTTDPRILIDGRDLRTILTALEGAEREVERLRPKADLRERIVNAEIELGLKDADAECDTLSAEVTALRASLARAEERAEELRAAASAVWDGPEGCVVSPPCGDCRWCRLGAALGR